LIDGDADARGGVAKPRVDAVQPRLLDDAVRARAFAALVAEAADHRDVLAVRRERLEDERKLEVAAGLPRLPLILERAVREVHEAELRRLCRGGLGESRAGGDHRVEQR